jgi:hypothetical protein
LSTFVATDRPAFIATVIPSEYATNCAAN